MSKKNIPESNDSENSPTGEGLESSDLLSLRCPECDHEIHVSPQAVIPDSQTLTWEITMEKDSPVAARTIGESINAMESLLTSVAENIGTPVAVFVTDMRMGNRKAAVDFLITAISSDNASSEAASK